MFRLTVSRSVCLGIKHPSGVTTRFLLLSDSCEFVDVGRSLWREDGSVVYNCCWTPAQSFSGPSPVGLATIFYCLRFETSFSSPPTTSRATVEVFDPASTQDSHSHSWFCIRPKLATRGPEIEHNVLQFLCYSAHLLQRKRLVIPRFPESTESSVESLLTWECILESRCLANGVNL
jgi:hypothetical protein